MFLYLSRNGIDAKPLSLFESYYLSEESSIFDLKKSIYETLAYFEKGNMQKKKDFEAIVNKLNCSTALSDLLKEANDIIDRQNKKGKV